MNFKDALKLLDIEDYGERIFNSNSNGELLHLIDYCIIADNMEDRELRKFRDWFLKIIDSAKNWDRPESIYQHLFDFL